MTQKLAIVIVHGIGNQDESFADDFIAALTQSFENKVNTPSQLVIEPMFWGSVFQKKEIELWQHVQKGGKLDFTLLRRFVIDFFGDAIAYQPAFSQNPNYDKVHEVYARTLRSLSERAGGKAPLIVIAHSLGAVISSNYFYDLQFIPDRISSSVLKTIKDTPLEKGETLTSFFSLGCPLALWSLRYASFDRPIAVPDPRLSGHFSDLKGEWINCYDKDDVVAFPLKTLNIAYEQAVSEDIEINSGSFLASWSPMSHLYYLKNKSLTHMIAEKLASIWKTVNR
ncbi:chemotaxis protein [Fictibacillus sp. Mic-4]|uniref:hypothetical protein n=1 Tax=Fictibacillus TaxID=1329200 RepID=UPI000401F836|nr:hypothetical protein [Fictibacillus gelatini]